MICTPSLRTSSLKHPTSLRNCGVCRPILDYFEGLFKKSLVFLAELVQDCCEGRFGIPSRLILSVEEEVTHNFNLNFVRNPENTREGVCSELVN
jgi:hypothetical protein